MGLLTSAYQQIRGIKDFLQPARFRDTVTLFKKTTLVSDLAVTGTASLSSATLSGDLSVTGDVIASSALSQRNMIINGSMAIAQRSADPQVTVSQDYSSCDRWFGYQNAGGAFVSLRHGMSVADIGTTGQPWAFRLICTTGVDPLPSAASQVYVSQHIEAQDLQHLRYGSASAKTLVLSFWVQSSKTGTYCVCIRKPDTTAYYLPIEYSISAANTWEYKTLLISPTAGSTSLITASGGAITKDTGSGLEVMFWLGAGSNAHGANNTWNSSADYTTSNQVNWLDTTSNTFYLTGVQLELGSNATPFEHRTYGDELKQCQRYYVSYGVDEDGQADVVHPTRYTAALFDQNTISSGRVFANVEVPTELRTGAPTFTARAAFNISGSNLSNTNWGPIASVGNKRSIPMLKTTNTMTTNQQAVYLVFEVDDEI
jgi:hypothetical protein